MYIIVIVAFLDTFIQLPIITPYALSLGASYTLAGAIVAIYSFTNMIGNVIGGHWIDKFGRKRMLYIGMASVAFILFLYPFAQTAWQLFIARFFLGLVGGVLIPYVFAYIGDKSIIKTCGKSMALTGASIVISAIVGRAIGVAIAARALYKRDFILVGVLFAISTIIVLN